MSDALVWIPEGQRTLRQAPLEELQPGLKQQIHVGVFIPDARSLSQFAGPMEDDGQERENEDSDENPGKYPLHVLSAIAMRVSGTEESDTRA
ncbi:MAG: hypothetical protein Kow0099_02300 [Candidatus Abyssubacteria bacterium]